MSATIELLSGLEQAMRGGFAFRQAVPRVAGDIEHGGRLDPLLDALERNPDLRTAVDSWSSENDDDELELVAAAVRMQFEDRGNLADTFYFLRRILEHRHGQVTP